MDRYLQEYRYERLDLGTSAFRLLRIPRGYYGSPMQCEIFQSCVDREFGVPYEALSYTWGDTSIPTMTIDILGNESTSTSYLNIYPTLHIILQHLRRADEDRVVWVDAICIDQSGQKDSLRERTHQVEQMKLVYERADRVIVWLGSLYDIESVSSDGMAMLAEARKELERVPIVESTRMPGTRAWSIARQALIKNRSQEEYQYMCAAVKHLLGQPYFTRMWIIQEVASARSGFVVCGDGGITVSIPMRLFMLLPSLLGLHPERHVQAILDAMPMSYQRRTGWWNEKNNLGTLLVKFQDSKCTDPRDSVYALLGISSDPGLQQTLRPDYGVTVGQVFQNTLSWLLFGVVEPGKNYGQDCHLPYENFWIQDADNIAALCYKILLWALDYGRMGHGDTWTTLAARLLGSGHIKIDYKPLPTPQPRTLSTFRIERSPLATVEKLLAGPKANADQKSTSSSSIPMSELMWAAKNVQPLNVFQLVLTWPDMTIPVTITNSANYSDLFVNEESSAVNVTPVVEAYLPELAAVDVDDSRQEWGAEIAEGFEVEVAPEVIQLLLCEPDVVFHDSFSFGGHKRIRGCRAMKRAAEKGHLSGLQRFMNLRTDFGIQAYLLWQVAMERWHREFQVKIDNVGEQVMATYVAVFPRAINQGQVPPGDPVPLVLLQPENIIVDCTSEEHNTQVWRVTSRENEPMGKLQCSYATDLKS